MSRGPGRVERQLIEIFRKSEKPAFSTAELCRKVYRIKRVSKKHRVSVLRALDRISNRSEVNIWRAVQRGLREDWWFDYDKASPRKNGALKFAAAKDKRPKKLVLKKYKLPWKYKILKN